MGGQIPQEILKKKKKKKEKKKKKTRINKYFSLTREIFENTISK